MLRKLLKYEIKATGRTFLPLYAALFLFALISKIFNFANDTKGALQVPAVISMGIYISIIVAIFVLTFVMMIQRFQKNLLSDEGYLMFTLPVESWKHILSKLITSLLWIFLSGVVTMLSAAVLAGTWEMWKALPAQFSEFLRYINQHMRGEAYLFLFEAIIICITFVMLGILLIYASIALGHLFGRHRMLAAIGAFLVLNTLMQIIVTVIKDICIRIYPNITVILEPDIIANHGVLWLAVLGNLIFCGIYFAITNYILTNRLNME